MTGLTRDEVWVNGDGEAQVRRMMWSRRAEREKLVGWEEHRKHGGVNKADAGQVWREKQAEKEHRNTRREAEQKTTQDPENT